MKKTVLEYAISSVAPHCCILCNQEGAVLCKQCAEGFCRPIRACCFMCNGLSEDFRTCANCRRKTTLRRVWVRTRYESYVKQLIRSYKFDRQRAAHVLLGQLMLETIATDSYDLVTSVPIATARYRLRGYNQASLLAREIARARKLPFAETLGRHGKRRQVGQSRAGRLTQLDGLIYPVGKNVQNKRVLLVDDIMTTGATLHECAKVLKTAGAKSIEATVIAHG